MNKPSTIAVLKISGYVNTRTLGRAPRDATAHGKTHGVVNFLYFTKINIKFDGGVF